MRKVKGLMAALVAFLMTLFRRTGRIQGLSPNGHVLMEGWSAAPEENLVRRLELQRERSTRPSRVTLYGLEGNHAGESFSLAQSVELIGKEVDCSLVLTPMENVPPQRCRLFINGVIRMLADTGSYFKVNGMETEHAELFDYDEIECLGNRFLVLVTSTGEGR